MVKGYVRGKKRKKNYLYKPEVTPVPPLAQVKENRGSFEFIHELLEFTNKIVLLAFAKIIELKLAKKMKVFFLVVIF